jgi:heme/copper-type cytochrome/quinol oxidase subunit 2
MFFSRFEEEIFTTGEVRDSCIAISSPPEHHSMTRYIVVGVTVTVVLLVLASVAFFHYKTRRKQGNMHCCMLSSG